MNLCRDSYLSLVNILGSLPISFLTAILPTIFLVISAAPWLMKVSIPESFKQKIFFNALPKESTGLYCTQGYANYDGAN